MKKKHTAGYNKNGTVKPSEKINLPDSPKMQEFKVARNTRQVKIKMPDGKIKIINIPIPKKIRIGSAKYITSKKGGKIK